MRKLTSILFLALILFNFGGYLFWYAYVQNKSDRIIETSLAEENYNSNDLVTIKVPLSMPYIHSWSEFERVNGEIEIAGRVYKFVKRKIYEGQLILLCLPDDQKTQLKTAKEEFFKLVNDLSSIPSSKKQGNDNTSSFKNILGDYDDQKPGWLSCRLANQVEYPLPVNQTVWSSPSYVFPGEPPELKTA